MGAREITRDLLGMNLGDIFKEITPKIVLDHCLERIAFVQKDLDMSGDMNDAAYYAGMIDAYHDVVGLVAPFKDEVSETNFLALIDKKKTVLEVVEDLTDTIKESAA